MQSCASSTTGRETRRLRPSARRPRRTALLAAAAGTLALLLSTASAGAVETLVQPGDVPRVVVAGEPVEPVPVAVPVDPALADLGRHLFFDTRLSGDGTLSCASCHDLATGGDDGRPRSVGPGGALRPYNAPSLFNLAFHDRYGWSAEHRSLPAQVGHAVEDEMGATWAQVTARLADDPAVTRRAPQGLDRPLAEAALAAYVASLVTPDSRFDRWLTGDAAALTEEERRGYALFKSYGCASCHQGKAMGGTMVQKVGLFRPFFPRRGESPDADLGRFAVTGQEQDRHVFKVPSLRNVAETAPYLHDGSVATLEGAVRLMAYYQVGRSPDDAEIAAISAFLRTLTGRPPGTIRPPVRKVGS